jgi:hypothetical protein
VGVEQLVQLDNRVRQPGQQVPQAGARVVGSVGSPFVRLISRYFGDYGFDFLVDHVKIL